MKVKVTDIGPEDAYFESKSDVLGKTITISDGVQFEPENRGPDWVTIFGTWDHNRSDACLYQCKVEIVDYE